ncbi:SPOR domain-containing protein [Psychroflexus sp. ALD_RP9]|uniref:SPOR domain-containing protein n=1 Tax=Psychroflexus sp. ALD_RP9 TaxID=2777186 RepID=UPI001A90469E|nr:SPOR domain-containing protein [Psychroflexus sp. ALD_RP9]QSS96162.1 SPOR domain-containing protein [Psychroflexus sp. ALD_RP9]
MKLKLLIIVLIGFNFSFSQHKIEGEKLKLTEELLSLKTSLVKNYQLKSTYRIQLFSGSLDAAQAKETEYQESGLNYTSFIYYEAPNYKLWVGNFKTKLDADRAYLEIKSFFPNALVFRPGR